MVAKDFVNILCVPATKLVQLNTLKNSARNWTVSLSLTVWFLKIEKSKLLRPGPRKLLRPTLPNSRGAGGAKQFALM